MPDVGSERPLTPTTVPAWRAAPAPGRRNGAAGRRLAVLLGATWLLMLGAFVAVTWTDRMATLEEGWLSAERGALGAAGHAEAALATAQMVTERVALAVMRHGTERFRGETGQAALAAYARFATQIGSLWVVDAEGRLAANTLAPEPARVDLSDRPYVTPLRDGAEIALMPLLRGGVSGVWYFSYNRRIEDAAGRFAGVVQAALHADAFQRFYAGLGLGPGARLDLLRVADGAPLMVWPMAAEDANSRSTPSPPEAAALLEALRGNAARTGRLDAAGTGGAPLMLAWRRFGEDAAFVAAAAVSRDAALAPFRTRLLRNAALLTLSLGALLGLGSAVARAQRQGAAAQRAAEAGRRELAAMLEATGDGVIAVDRAWRITFLNRRADEMLGGGRDLRGQDVWEAFPGAVGGPFQAAFLRTMERRLPALVDAASGLLGRHVRAESYPREDGGLVVFFRDVTEARAAEAALAESEATLRRVVEEAPIPVMVHDEDGRVLHLSRTWTRLTGYGTEDIPTIAAWMERAYGADAGRARAVIRAAFARAPGEPFEGGQFTIRTATGDWRLWHFRATPTGRDATGRRLLVSMAVDVTEASAAQRALAESEATLRALHENSPLLIGTVELLEDGDLLHLHDNPAACRFLGLEPGATTRRTARAMGVPEPTIAVWRWHYEQAAASGGPITFEHTEEERAKPAGARRCLAVTVSPLGPGPGGRPRLCYVAEEVTARRAAEAALAEREALLTAVGRSTPDLIFAKDAEGRLLYANPPTLAMIGKPAEQVIGRTDADYIDDPAQARVFMENDRRIMARGEAEAVEEVVTDASRGGELRVMLSTKAPLRDAALRVVGLVGVSRDVTQERAAQDALAAAKERLEVALRGADLGTWHWHLPSGRASYDERWLAMLGYGAGEIPPTYDGWVTLAHPEDRARADAAMAAHRDGRAPFYESEHRLRHRDGNWVWVLARGRIVERDEAGRPVVATGTHLDITARKQAEAALAASEERFSFALEAAGGIGAWDWDVAADRVTADATFAAMFGLDAAAAAGAPVADYVGGIHAEDRGRVGAEIARAVACPDAAEYTSEFRVVDRSGALRWVVARGRCYHDAEGRPTRFPGIVFDITARKEAEERRMLLAREVDHRAKNVLAVVQSIVRLTREEDPVKLRAAITGRIAAMSRAHTLLAREGWDGAELQVVVREELAAHGPGSGGAERIRVAGPSVWLAPRAVQPVAMALHELATNAVKYGALSTPDGWVELSWTCDAASGDLGLRWVERGGPPVEGPPERRGFGSSVIANTIERQLQGQVQLDWAHEGLRCDLRLPARQLRWPPVRGGEAG